MNDMEERLERRAGFTGIVELEAKVLELRPKKYWDVDKREGRIRMPESTLPGERNDSGENGVGRAKDALDLMENRAEDSTTCSSILNDETANVGGIVPQSGEVTGAGLSSERLPEVRQNPANDI